MPPTTLQAAQDNLVVLQAESTQNDATFALYTAQYNQRKNSFAAQITSAEAIISKLTSAPTV